MDHDIDTDELESIASEAVEGEIPVLTEDLGHELLELVKLVDAPVKEFDPWVFGGVSSLDVEYEGCNLSPSSEYLTIVVRSLNDKIVRRIRLDAPSALKLCDLVYKALPSD